MMDLENPSSAFLIKHRDLFGIFNTSDHEINIIACIQNIKFYLRIITLPNNKQLMHKCLTYFFYIYKV